MPRPAVFAVAKGAAVAGKVPLATRPTVHSNTRCLAIPVPLPFRVKAHRSKQSGDTLPTGQIVPVETVKTLGLNFALLHRPFEALRDGLPPFARLIVGAFPERLRLADVEFDTLIRHG